MKKKTRFNVNGECRGGADQQTTEVEFNSRKRTELVKLGYRIVGNIGDQWSDFAGPNAGTRVWVFKLPNPMYFIGWEVRGMT